MNLGDELLESVLSIQLFYSYAKFFRNQRRMVGKAEIDHLSPLPDGMFAKATAKGT